MSVCERESERDLELERGGDEAAHGTKQRRVRLDKHDSRVLCGKIYSERDMKLYWGGGGAGRSPGNPPKVSNWSRNSLLSGLLRADFWRVCQHTLIIDL